MQLKIIFLKDILFKHQSKPWVSGSLHIHANVPFMGNKGVILYLHSLRQAFNNRNAFASLWRVWPIYSRDLPICFPDKSNIPQLVGQILKIAFYHLDFLFTQSILEFDLLGGQSWCRYFPTAPKNTKNRFVLNPFFTTIREVDWRIKEVGHRYQGSMIV